MKTRKLTGAVLLWLWMSAGAGATTTTPSSLEQVPSFTVTRMSEPPTIDGVIDAVEWQEALAIGGVADQSTDMSKPLIPRPTTFLLGWDPDHMYFASRTYIKQGYKPYIPVGRSHGLAYVWDDALELNWHPMGANVPAENKANSYKWFLNALGFIGDTSRLAVGQQFKSWNPQFVIEARLTEPGSAPDGGRWWEMEMRATTEDFELDGPHQAGDQWKIMLGINHFPGWMQARVPCRGPYLDPHGYNVMTLAEETPAVQVTMESLSNLATDGTAAITVGAYNPTNEPADLSLSIDIASVIQRDETFHVPPGQRVDYRLDEALPEGLTAGKARVQVREGERSLYDYVVPFEVGAYGFLLGPSSPPDTTSFVFEARFNPVRSWLLIKGDTYYLEDSSEAQALRYQVVRLDDDGEPLAEAEPVAEGHITLVADYFLQDMLQLPALASGTYRVEGTMELTGGRTRGPMSATFVKKDEAKEYAHWWGKKHGDIERVLPPYTALKTRGSTVESLGREYELNALGLPGRIVSNGEAVSAQPARVIVVVDGVEHAINLGEPEITETTDWRVRFTGSAEGAGLRFTAMGWIEQDGLVYTDLTYEPAGEPVTIEALRLEYPLAEEDADGLLCIGPGANYSSRTTMLLPDDEQGSLWSTLDTGINGSGMTVGSFYPTVWIGSERRGFLWWADNDRGWIQNNAVPAHEAVRKDGAVVFINHIVGKPSTLAEPRTLSLSWIATPFKPMPKGWRMAMATADGTFHQPFRNVRTDSKTGQKVFQNPGGGLLHVNWIHPESRYPEEWEDLWHQQRTEGFGRWEAADSVAHRLQWQDPYAVRGSASFTHMSFQIYGYGRKTLEDHLYDYFGAEWEPDTWHESYTDYAMYLFDSAFHRGGVRSTYWDLLFPMPFTDLLTGLAYRLPDGRVQAGYHGWNLRRFNMRLYALQEEAGLYPGANGSHSTNAYVPVAMPWLDAVLDGERNYDLASTPLDWVDNMPIDRMRSMSIPQSWGVAICWMANYDSEDKEAIDAAKRVQGQWVWMHDSWRNPYIPQLPVMPDPVLNWGVNDVETVYHPYWRNSHVSSPDDDVLVSLWLMPGRAMLGVFNYNKDESKDVRLEVDLQALGLSPHQTTARTLWVESTGRATLEAKTGALQVESLPGHRLILIGLDSPVYKELERAVMALPAEVGQGRELLSAMTGFGLVDAEAVRFAPGDAPGVKSDDTIDVAMWRLPDRVMLTVRNDSDDTRDAVLQVDLDALGLAPQLPWQEFVRIRDLWSADKSAPASVLDFHGRTLTVGDLSPNEVRLVGIRRY